MDRRLNHGVVIDPGSLQLMGKDFDRLRRVGLLLTAALIGAVLVAMHEKKEQP